MAKQNLFLGKSGEKTAADFLKENGYKILSQNYKTKLGEVDIVAKDRDTFCFVEVKTRHSDKFGLPLEAVNSAKKRQVSKAALNFLKTNNLLDKKARFDVVSVVCADDKPKVDLIKNAFELDERFSY